MDTNLPDCMEMNQRIGYHYVSVLLPIVGLPLGFMQNNGSWSTGPAQAFIYRICFTSSRVYSILPHLPGFWLSYEVKTCILVPIKLRVLSHFLFLKQLSNPLP